MVLKRASSKANSLTRDKTTARDAVGFVFPMPYAGFSAQRAEYARWPEALQGPTPSSLPHDRSASTARAPIDASGSPAYPAEVVPREVLCWSVVAFSQGFYS